ncbi:MAG: MotA/TolQ/ExbB proton channel family protein [Fibromonadales bacterium]|nr:MotA/TolQ/ExbB proton channel family protein [Fibromonadales bacterium]
MPVNLIHIYEQVFDLLRKGGVIMPIIFAVGWLAWILVLTGKREHYKNIATLAAIAPLLGLLGTVMGMVHTFETIKNFGFGNPVLLADGISEALLTTQAGLLVAFPLLLANTYLKRRNS